MVLIEKLFKKKQKKSIFAYKPGKIKQPNAETQEAMYETELILEDYNQGTRLAKPYKNASEMFAAMDEEDEAEEELE